MSGQWVPAEHGTERGGLHQRVARGLVWTLIDNWGSQLAALVIFLVLVTLLDPVHFGLVALAAVFVQFAQLFVDQGLGDALIQRRVLTRRLIDTAFWVAIATSLALTALGLVLAGPIAALTNEPDLEPLLQVLSLTFVLAALSSIQVALLRREMAFRSLAIRRLVALAIGGVVGIVLAYNGFGAWALVGQQLATGLGSVVLLWAVSPWRPGLTFSLEDFRSLAGFGVKIVGSDVLTFASRNTDNLLIGVFMSTTALGFYAVGYRILDVSQTILLNVARKLAFPAFSRLQTAPERLHRAYVRMTRVVATVTMPGYIGLALIVQDALILLAGVRWAEAGPVAAVLLLIGPALTIQGFAGALLNAVGQPGINLRFRLLTTVVNIAGFVVAVLVFQNIVAVAAAFVIRGYILMPVLLTWIRPYGGSGVVETVRSLAGVLAATTVMAIAVAAVKIALGGSTSLGVLLAVEVAVGMAAYGLAILIFGRSALAETLGFVFDALPDRFMRGRHDRRRQRRRTASPTEGDEFDLA